MSKKTTYEPPYIEAIRLSSALSLLETLSTEGEIGDWTQENPIDTIELE